MVFHLINLAILLLMAEDFQESVKNFVEIHLKRMDS